MAGRNDATIVAALEAMAQALENQPNAYENVGSRSLATFKRENLPVFKGRHDPNDALEWFTELAKFYLHYDGEGDEFSKCIKFENGLRSEIKKVVKYQKILVFPELVDSYRIFGKDNNAHYKVVTDMRGKNQQNHGKPYDVLAGRGRQRAALGQKTSGGTASGIVCFKYGQAGHKSTVFNADVKRCFRCGKTGHAISDYKHKEMVCFNCGEEGHIGSQCLKPKKAQSSGKVFALAGDSSGNEDRLIREEEVGLVSPKKL
ncbi:uncharacterized protein LOC131636800 [Vicia villosa]|uniref:uncharacterized protein LOC131636800 n=1 Tax=Vicia villosa TaxID=3911 RepID=UPI00273AC764|nr:uncharacterized protein LOC131636800 [Vicia villosa]